MCEKAEEKTAQDLKGWVGVTDTDCIDDTSTYSCLTKLAIISSFLICQNHSYRLHEAYKIDTRCIVSMLHFHLF